MSSWRLHGFTTLRSLPTTHPTPNALEEAPPTALHGAEWMIGLIPAEVRVQKAFEDKFRLRVDVNPHVSFFIDLD